MKIQALDWTMGEVANVFVGILISPDVIICGIWIVETVR